MRPLLRDTGPFPSPFPKPSSLPFRRFLGKGREGSYELRKREGPARQQRCHAAPPAMPLPLAPVGAGSGAARSRGASLGRGRLLTGATSRAASTCACTLLCSSFGDGSRCACAGIGAPQTGFAARSNHGPSTSYPQPPLLPPSGPAHSAANSHTEAGGMRASSRSTALARRLCSTCGVCRQFSRHFEIIHTHTHTQTHTCIYRCVFRHVHVYVYAYECARTHTPIHSRERD